MFVGRLHGPVYYAGMLRRSARGRLPRLVAGIAALALVLPTLAIGPPTAAAEDPLRYFGGEINSLDPAFIGSQSDVQLMLQLYAGLTRLDEDGDPYPSLAEAWSVSDDGLTYEFSLRAGLTFSDGTPLTSADVRRSWLRLLDPATGARAPDVLSVVVGARERMAGGPEADVGVAAPEPQRLVVRLRHAAGYFPAITATPTAFVVPPAADASPDWQAVGSFVGSGPYVAESLDADALTLRANPRYVLGPPPIDEVRWVTDLPGDTATAFADGELDLTSVAASDAEWIAFDSALGPALHIGADVGVQYIAFDATAAPFDDPRVRRAFSLALDRPRLVALAEGSAARPASSVVPPALWPDGFAEDLASDPDEARRLLDEAGYADRSTLGTITINGAGLGVGPAVAVWREELGVTIAIEGMEFRDYIDTLDAGRPPHIYTINWIADYPTPYALYSLLLLPGAASNYGGWTDAEFVSLVEAASAAQGDEAQAVAYAAVDARVDDQAPVIPWAYPTGWWLARPGLRGLGELSLGLLDFGLVSWDD